MINKKTTRNAYVYRAYNLSGELVYEGSVNDVADFFSLDSQTIYSAGVGGYRLLGEYKITRVVVSVVGSNFMTMLKDIEVNGTDNKLREISETLSKFIVKMEKFKKFRDNDSELFDLFVESCIMLDEFKLILNQETDLNITNKKLNDLKHKKLKTIAESLENY